MNDCRIFDLAWISTNKDFDKFFKNCPGLIAVRVLEEYIPSDDIIQSFQSLSEQSQKFPEKKVVLLTELYRRRILDSVWPAGFETVELYSDTLLMTYKRLVIDRESDIAESWNPKKQKWLFLMGKIDRMHRLGLLYFLSKKNLLDQCTWSLRFNPDNLESYQEFLPDMTLGQISQWLSDHSRSPDQINPFTQPDAEPHYSGIPYGDVYENALFQVISETVVTGKTIAISEKTWLSILNRRPFILFGVPGTYQLLEQVGFNMYREFLLDTKFDTDIDIQDRFESLAANIVHWMKIIRQHQDKISEITESNYNKAIELAEYDISQLRRFTWKYKTDVDIFSLVNLTELSDLPHRIEHAKWQNFYARIRDSSWPDCPNEEDFVNLPDCIQQECIEVFGYQPKENK